MARGKIASDEESQGSLAFEEVPGDAVVKGDDRAVTKSKIVVESCGRISQVDLRDCEENVDDSPLSYVMQRNWRKRRKGAKVIWQRRLGSCAKTDRKMIALNAKKRHFSCKKRHKNRLIVRCSRQISGLL